MLAEDALDRYLVKKWGSRTESLRLRDFYRVALILVSASRLCFGVRVHGFETRDHCRRLEGGSHVPLG